MEETLKVLDKKLEVALKDAQTRYRSSWALGRWWAKQRIAWLENLHQDLSRFSTSPQEARNTLLHWRPKTVWLKVFSFFDHLFYQIRTQLRQALRDPVKKIESLRKQFIVYGKLKHQGTHPHCLTGEMISGHYTHFEWIQKLGIEDNWEQARKSMIEHAQEATPSSLGLNDQRKHLQKYRRLIYFARAQKEIARFTQTNSLDEIQFDVNTLNFFDELNSVVEQAKKHGDTSRGINMLFSFALFPRFRAEADKTTQQYREACQHHEKEEKFLNSEKKKWQQQISRCHYLLVQTWQKDLEALEQQFLILFERGHTVKLLGQVKITDFTNAYATWQTARKDWEAKKEIYQARCKHYTTQIAWILDREEWHEDLKQAIAEDEATLLSAAICKRLLIFDKPPHLVEEFKKAKQAYQAVLKNFFEKARYATWSYSTPAEFAEAKTQDQTNFVQCCHTEAQAYSDACLAITQSLAEIDNQIHQGALIVAPPALSAFFTPATPGATPSQAKKLTTAPPAPQKRIPTPAAASSQSRNPCDDKDIKMDDRFLFICQRWAIPLSQNGTLSLNTLKKHRRQWACATHPDSQQKQDDDDFSAKFNEVDFKQSQIELTLLENWLTFKLKKRTILSLLSPTEREKEKEETASLLKRLEEVKRSLNTHIQDQHTVLKEAINSTHTECDDLNRRLATLFEQAGESPASPAAAASSADGDDNTASRTPTVPRK